MEPSLLDLPHFDGRRYFCPWARENNSLVDVVRWKLARNRYRGMPRLPAPRATPDPERWNEPVQGLELTWVGQQTFVVRVDGAVLVTDPHFGPRALLPKRLVEPGLRLERIPADAVGVVSHNHYDHLDRWTWERLPAGVAAVAPLGHRRFFATIGREVIERDWWGSAEVRGWRLTAVPVQHWSNRLLTPRDAALWCGWLIERAGFRVFFGGDTGYFPLLAEIGRRLGPVDGAILPIGAYAPRWFMRRNHMGPEEALDARRDLGARTLVAGHWGTFDLSDEPPQLPAEELLTAAAERGEEGVVVLPIGGSWSVPPSRR